MAQFTWVFDAPTGVYKNHQLSRRLFMAAVEESVFVEHTPVAEGYGKNQGESITFTRVSNITEPDSPYLSETDRIPEDPFNISTKGITVREIGRAVPNTSLSNDLSAFDMENAIQRKLREQMTLSIDTMASAAFKRAQIKYTPTGATSNDIQTGGAFGAVASANYGMWHVEEIQDLLYDTYHVPPAVEGDYIAIFRTLGIRGLMRDQDWQNWQQYTDPRAKFNSEAGRWEATRHIKTNHGKALGRVGTGGNTLGEGVVFGEDAVRMAVAMDPELRSAIPDDFGRSRATAWYGIQEFDQVWDTSNAGEARIVHVGSQ